MIGGLQRVPLREVWRHEALDFTTWLETNLDVLNDALDIRLSDASLRLGDSKVTCSLATASTCFCNCRSVKGTARPNLPRQVDGEK